MKKLLYSLSITFFFLLIACTVSCNKNNTFNNIDTLGLFQKVRNIISTNSTNLDSLQKALNLSEISGNNLLIGECRNKMGAYYYGEDNYAVAINNYLLAADTYLSINDSLKYASCLRLTAIMYEYAGDYNKSLTFYKQSLKNFKTLKYINGLATINSDIGVLYWNKSEYAKALEYFNKSFEYIEELNDSSYYSPIYNNMGLVYWNLGDYEVALNYFYKSLEIDELMNNVSETSYSLNNIGLIHEEMKEYDKALNYYKQSLEIELAQGNESEAATSYSNIGVIYGIKKDYEKALEYTNKSLAIQTKLNYKVGIAYACLNISNIYYMIKDFKNALNYNARSMSIRKELDNKQGVAACHIKYGEIYLELENYSKAIKHLNKALEISKNIDSKEDVMVSMELLSIVYSNSGEYKNAYELRDEYDKLKEQLYSEEKSKRISEMQIRFDVQKKEQQIKLLNKEQDLKEAELEKSEAKIIYQRKIKNYSIVLFVFVLSILGLIFNRYKINQKKTKVLLQKRTIEIENKLLRSQMNPHFIFNSLYSIQSFVAKNQSDLAVSHLSDFASLMRAILHNSAKSFISLEKELETIELYLKLEKLRFENRFDYIINIPESLELDFIQIPPMLIQPFIENAILHGLSNKKEKGNLTISFKEVNSLHLLCVVSDNGIGRKRARLLKEKSNKEHKSMGLDITGNRLELLNKEQGTQGKITVCDLNTENNTGTVVEILIPIKET